MDIFTLANILHLPEPPRMRPAKLVGYHLMLWSESPALLDLPGHEVYGRAYEIQDQEQFGWLPTRLTNTV